MKDFSTEWYEEHEYEEIDIDDNICECAKWIIGEDRCACGARRIYLDEVDDNFYVPAGD